MEREVYSDASAELLRREPGGDAGAVRPSYEVECGGISAADPEAQDRVSFHSKESASLRCGLGCLFPGSFFQF